MARESIVLFGEGKTETIFLDHLKTVYEAHNITLVLSMPKCIEGFMLKILDELPKGAAHSSSKDLKSAFMKYLVTTESGYARKFADKCPALFPKELLDARRRHIPELDAILHFLNV
jgi:hypothetical protein